MEKLKLRPVKRDVSEKQEKAFDPSRVVRHLTFMFERATLGMGSAERVKVKGKKIGRANDLYRLQEDFAYLIDEIERGPKFSALKAINSANELIDSINDKKAG